MFTCAADREIAELAWQEYQAELDLDQNLIELWEAAQERDRATNDEVLALVAAGDGEKEGVF